MIPTLPAVDVDFEVSVTAAAAPSSNAAWLALVGSPAGASLRASPDNLLAKTAASLGFTVADGPRGTKDLDWAQLDWLLLRAVDLAQLRAQKAHFISRPSTLGAVLQHLVEQGGLKLSGLSCPGAAAAEVARAAAVAPALQLELSDIIVLPVQDENNWLKHLTVAMLGPAHGPLLGTCYAQLRAMLGAPRTKAALTALAPVLDQVPYTLQPLVGDIQGIAPALQARMAGQAMVRSMRPHKFDRFDLDALVEVYRRAGPDPFGPLFDDCWVQCYPTIAKLMHATERNAASPPAAQPSEARSAVVSAALTLGMGDSFSESLVSAVDSSLAAVLQIAMGTDGMASKTATERIAIAARAAVRGSTAKTTESSQAASSLETMTSESPDSVWLESMASNKEFIALVTELKSLNTTPMDLLAVTKTMMASGSAAGRIFLVTTRVPNVPVLKVMSAARSTAIVQKVVNDTCCFDRAGTAKPHWGTPLAASCCTKLLRGQFCEFESLEERNVKPSKTALHWWDDIVAPMLYKEHGCIDSPPKATDALSVFSDAN